MGTFHDSIYDALDLDPVYFTWCILPREDNSKEAFIHDYISTELHGDTDIERILALMVNQDMSWDYAVKYVDDGEWLVLTLDEANEEAKDYAENYLEDIIVSDIPGYLRHYFNRDSWLEDYLAEGNGTILAHYDGVEWTEEVNGTTYYLYQRYK